MNFYTFLHAFTSTFLAVLTHIIVTITTVQLVGDDTEKGIIGLYGLIIMYVPFLLILTWPMLVVLIKKTKSRKTALKVLYGSLLVVAITLGLFSGLQ